MERVSEQLTDVEVGEKLGQDEAVEERVEKNTEEVNACAAEGRVSSYAIHSSDAETHRRSCRVPYREKWVEL